MDFSTPTLDVIKHDLKNAQVVNSDQILYNRIKESGDSKEQLKKIIQHLSKTYYGEFLSNILEN